MLLLAKNWAEDLNSILKELLKNTANVVNVSRSVIVFTLPLQWHIEAVVVNNILKAQTETALK